jgi:hypothetical protein
MAPRDWNRGYDIPPSPTGVSLSGLPTTDLWWCRQNRIAENSRGAVPYTDILLSSYAPTRPLVRIRPPPGGRWLTIHGTRVTGILPSRRYIIEGSDRVWTVKERVSLIAPSLEIYEDLEEPPVATYDSLTGRFRFADGRCFKPSRSDASAGGGSLGMGLLPDQEFSFSWFSEYGEAVRYDFNPARTHPLFPQTRMSTFLGYQAWPWFPILAAIGYRGTAFNRGGA